MNNNECCEYGINELKYLPDNYRIVMDGAQFWLLATMVLSEPGNICVPIEIVNIIDSVKLYDDKNASNDKTIAISKEQILALCNYKKMAMVSVVSNKNVSICADIKTSIEVYLVGIKANGALLKAKNVNGLDSLPSFIAYIKGDNIPTNVRCALASYARICLKEFQNNMDNELYKEMDNKINKLFIR